MKNFGSACLLLLLFACAHRGNLGYHRQPASVENNPVLALLGEDIAAFQGAAEEALAWRAKSTRNFERLNTAAKREHLTHAQLMDIHNGGLEYLNIRAKLLETAHKQTWMVTPSTKIKFAPGSGTQVLEKNYTGLMRLFVPKPFTKMTIDPSDVGGRVLMTELKISLASALILYDNYLVGIYPYYENPKIRFLLNKDNPQTKDKLHEISENFAKLEQREMVVRAMQLFKKDLAWKKQAGDPFISREEEYLDQLIQESIMYNFVLEGKQAGPDEEAVAGAKMEDSFKVSSNALSYAISKFFGNSMGIFSSRKGLLTKLPLDERAQITGELEPLDILLEKTPFRLTDKFIPGHWGHVAIWVGNEEQLRNLGVWDHPAVVPHHEAVRSGRHIVEALRSGVEINSLDHFLNIDDMLALRHSALTLQDKQDFLVRTFQQIGKEYDFNFDVETDKRIVCSELAYVVYHNIQWPTSKSLGRYTISPDHVAIQSLEGPLVPVILYHDGKRFSDRTPGGLKQIVNFLLDENYKGLNQFVRANPVASTAVYPEWARDKNRAPASGGGVFKILEGIDPELTRDFFSAETYGKNLRFTVRAKLWTDLDKPYMQENLKSALEDAVAKTLDPASGASPLTQVLKKNLMSEFMQHFVYRLGVLKLVNGTVQVDFHFLPESDDAQTLVQEMASNQLVRFGAVGTLGKQLADLDSWSVTQQVRDMTPKIIALRQAVGKDMENVLVGGTVSLYLKLLDTHWRISKPIPNTGKNAVKGFVRYRRYFVRPSALPSQAAACEDPLVKLDRLEWDSKKSNPAQFYTVDVYKSFNLKGMIPEPDTVEIFPGRLLAGNEGRSDLLPKGHGFNGKSLRSGSLVLGGLLKSGSEQIRFSHKVDKLVFQLDKQAFDGGLSKMQASVELADGSSEASMDMLAQVQRAQESIHRMLDKCGAALVKDLKLGRFSLALDKLGRN